MDPTVLLQILITALTTLLENCPEPAEQKIKFLKSPRLIHELRLDMQLRRQGLSREDRKAARKLADDLKAEATDQDLKELVALSAAT